MESYSVSDLLLDEIQQLGSTHIFLVPGANISHLVGRLHARDDLTMIIANHELAAGFMAIGYAQASGKPGVVFSIGSPGLAYLSGSMMTAVVENIPLLCVSGNIPEKHWGKGEFQDGSHMGSNDQSIIEALRSNSLGCQAVSDIYPALDEIRGQISASKSAHLQLPIDIQSAKVTVRPEEPRKSSQCKSIELPQSVLPLKTAIVIGEINDSFLSDEARSKLSEQTRFGIITDIRSRGIISEDSICSLGHLGFNSSHRAIAALEPTSPFVAEKVFALGLNSNIVNRYLARHPNVEVIPFVNAAPWLTHLVVHECKGSNTSSAEWLALLQKTKGHQLRDRKQHETVGYLDLLDVCNQRLTNGCIYYLDSGQIRRAANIFLKIRSSRGLLQSNKLSPMGLGICGSIGAQAAAPNQRVIALFGDGSMRMHGTEIATAKRYGLPVIFVLCDNQSLASTPGDQSLRALPSVEWDAFGDAFGVPCRKSTNKQEFSESLDWALDQAGPVLLWAKVSELLEEELEIRTVAADASWMSAFQTE